MAWVCAGEGTMGLMHHNIHTDAGLGGNVAEENLLQHGQCDQE
jgi:hypothetical protein